MSAVSKNFSPLFHEFAEIGGFFDFVVPAPLRGWSQLSSVSLNTVGSNANKYLEVRVSYSTDAVRYSDFLDLSSAISVPIKSDFLVIVRLIRSGSDNTGTIVLNGMTLSGNYEQSYYDVLDLSSTIFSGIAYEDERWNKLWLNLFQKIYKEGIIPKFIERSEDSSNDKTYIEYWKYQCMFWALCVELGMRKLENLRNDRGDLIEYLKQKTFLICEDEDNIESLRYLMENAWDEIRQRGTFLINHKSNVPIGGGVQTYPIGADLNKQVDGELLRYLCYNGIGEHTFAHYSRHLSGWLLDNTSPNFFCYSEQSQLNKSPLKSRDFVDLDGFTVYNSNQVQIEEFGITNLLCEDDYLLETEDGFHLVADPGTIGVLSIGASGIDVTDLLELEESVGDGFFVQEGASGYLALEENALVSELGIQGNGVKFEVGVDAKLSYECSFYVYCDTASSSSLSVWVKAFEGSQQVALLRADGALPLTLEANVIFLDGPLKSGKFWYFRFIIGDYFSQSGQLDPVTNWNTGNNLKFYTPDTDKIQVFLLNQGNEEFKIWDLKLRPMLFENTYGLDNYNTTVLLSRLNNNKINQQIFLSNVRQYLLPYGSNFFFLNLKNLPLLTDLATESSEILLTENEDKIAI